MTSQSADITESRPRSVPELFEQQVAATPAATALSAEHERLTYQELNTRANRLAHRLRAIGAAKGDPVGICVERSVDMVVGLIAILKAGCGYVALNPDDPPERQAAVARDAGVAMLLTHRHLAPPWAARRQLVRLDEDADQLPRDLPDVNPGVEVGPEDIAYIAYTSGSTGTPKGAVIPHRAVLRLVLAPNYLTVGPRDTVLQLAPLAFDASTWELWAPLLHGGRVALFPAGEPSSDRIAEVVKDEGVTVLWLTAGLFHQMADGPIARLRGVRALLAGGDVLSVPHVNRTLAALPDACMINGYGPTENTTFTCCHVMTEPVTSDAVPIGRPITGTQTYVLDAALRRVPTGQTGELHAGGDGVAHGYLGRPALTAEMFLPDPFASRPGARMYRTGDLARQRDDGVIEFLGRTDDQVKIRGFRIEPGEVEAALLRLPHIRDAAVVVQRRPRVGNQLIAFVVSDQTLSTSALREALSETLPSYAIPSSFTQLATLPLNRNGKVDRADLRRRRSRERPALDVDYRAPQNAVEEMLTELWGHLMEISAVGVDDNFFDLGGHSLTAMQTVSEIVSAYGVTLEPRDLHRRHTVAQLAELVSQRLYAEIEELSNEEALALLRAAQQAGSREAPRGSASRR